MNSGFIYSEWKNNMAIYKSQHCGPVAILPESHIVKVKSSNYKNSCSQHRDSKSTLLSNSQ